MRDAYRTARRLEEIADDTDGRADDLFRKAKREREPLASVTRSEGTDQRYAADFLRDLAEELRREEDRSRDGGGETLS